MTVDFEQDPPDFDHPIGWATFCEDIRQEHDGKYSLIGVLSGQIMAKSFPAIIPKFGVSIIYRQPPNIGLALVDFRVLWDNEDGNRSLIVSSPVDMREMARPADASWLQSNVNLVLSPFQVAGPGTLRVRAYRDDFPPLRLASVKFSLGTASRSGPESPRVIPMQPGGSVVVEPHKLP